MNRLLIVVNWLCGMILNIRMKCTGKLPAPVFMNVTCMYSYRAAASEYIKHCKYAEVAEAAL